MKMWLMMPRTARSALANQARLVLHTAAYWLVLTVRGVISRPHALATAEFMRLAWLVTKIAARVCVAFAAACPDAALFRGIDISLQRAGP
jgi:Transposase DDE domain group 1